MKAFFLVGIAALFISGCADMSAQKQEQYRDISTCDVSEANSAGDQLNKVSFANMLTSEAAIDSLERMTEKNKLDTLQIIGWDQGVAQSVSDCYRQKRIHRINQAALEFNKIKEKTSNKEERNALISSYSAWEAYIKNPSPVAENDFQHKVSFYKNM